jgi:hypothetical protein
MITDVRSRLPDVAVQLFVVVSLTCAYGLVEGNEGTAFRHRAHALLVFIIFAAASQVRPRAPVAGDRSVEVGHQLRPVDVGEGIERRIKAPVTGVDPEEVAKRLPIDDVLVPLKGRCPMELAQLRRPLEPPPCPSAGRRW